MNCEFSYLPPCHSERSEESPRPQAKVTWGSEGSVAPVGHPAKQEAPWSPAVRGARGGDTTRGARAIPYRNKQMAAATARLSAPIETADSVTF